ncbi:sce7725 family protein [Variovorax boronicumulans]|uniref:sce7725 family protein n=1 Tax=Variovorax boronicumulans TaxID=436515 RepID=UPI0027D76D39|nr:sce7725 family protein [Variovorax boronicumulans]
MYSPYLFARGSELLALRAVLAEGGDLSRLLPITEPVVTDLAALRRCMEAYAKSNQPLGVVINPYRHEFNDGGARSEAFRAGLQDLFSKHPNLLPTYRVHAGVTIAKAKKFFNLYKNRPVVLAYHSPTLSPAELKNLAAAPEIIFHVVMDQSITTDQWSAIPSKKTIDLRDHFNKLPRNADYSGREFFTDRHKLIGKSIAGIGDYATVGRNLDIGGGPPGAIAIHPTYRNKAGDIWIEHFVSDETDRSVGDIGAKFLDAAGKLTLAVADRPKEFGFNSAISEFQRHVEDGTFPGLGKNKEHQIHHHIRLMLETIADT